MAPRCMNTRFAAAAAAAALAAAPVVVADTTKAPASCFVCVIATARQTCGGTWISKNECLTAKSCLSGAEWIEVGQVTNGAKEYVASVNIGDVISHPKHNANNQEFDLALVSIRDGERMPYHKNVNHCVLNLPRGGEVLTDFWSFGFGSLPVSPGTKARTGNAADVYPQHLKKMRMSLVDAEDCKGQWNNGIEDGSLITQLNVSLSSGGKKQLMSTLENSMCALAVGENGQGPCNGDIGTGLVGRSADGKQVLSGVASMGLGCGTGVPGGYAGVEDSLAWLRQAQDMSSYASAARPTAAAPQGWVSAFAAAAVAVVLA